MNLPVLNTPKYEMVIPSSGETIEYRPFLVKEQKVLMMAQESGDQQLMVKSIGEIVKSCTFDKINTETSPIFDIEYIFLKLKKHIKNAMKFYGNCNYTKYLNNLIS